MKTSIRFLAVIFAVAMMVLSFVTVSANSFSDVTNRTPHAKAIDSLTSLGIIHGYEDNTFRPDLPVRRDEMAKLVYTTFTTSIDAGNGVVTFPDVAADSWAKGYISWCAGKKIVGGYEDGNFKPEGNVTYDEALKMVCAMLGYVDFDPEMWPVDVRLKALIDLNLGEGLDDVAGDAVLTRAQVAQLFHNSLDEIMYVAPVEDDKIGKLQFPATSTVQTLAKDVWGYTEAVAEIVATESWGLVVPYAIDPQVAEDEYFSQGKELPANIKTTKIVSRSYTKTEKENVVKLRFLDAEGNAIIENGEEKVEAVKLEDLGLEAYVGEADDLLGRCINIFMNKKGECTAANIMGKVVNGFEGYYSNLPTTPEDEVTYQHTPSKKLGSRYHKYGIDIEGIIHEYENFDAIRKLVYLDKAACDSLGYPYGSVLAQPATTSAGNYYLDEEGNIRNEVLYGAWAGNDNPSQSYKTLSFPRAIINGGRNPNYRRAIDSDGDGYFEYLAYSYYTAYFVESVSKNKVNLKSAYSTAKYEYEADMFNTNEMPEEGDLIVGYFIGDEFFHVGTANIITAFSTKYSTTKHTKGYFTAASTTLYGYTNYSGDTSLAPGAAARNSGRQVLGGITEAPEMAPYVGFNSEIGDYNYANYYIYNGAIIYATLATADDLKNVAGTQNRAILMYVDKPTEPQINEKTKQYETFYPAHLIINGKEELVNLNSTNAINGSEAAIIAQDGSMYRPYVKDGYVMYRNLLVNYKVDSEGYYSLTTADKAEPQEGEKVIAKGGYFLTINPTTGIMSIVDEHGDYADPDVKNIIANGTSIIYYPYIKKTTGAHEYIDFYLGSEIPSDFNKIELTGDTYLTFDEETGFYILSTAMVGLDGFESVGTTTKTADYKTDARYHLIALADSDVVYDDVDELVYASYYFQGIYEGTEVTGVNKEQDSDSAYPALTAGIYAWDEAEEQYVAVDSLLDSYSIEDIDTVFTDMSLVFTNVNTDGYKINETTKIIAIKDVPDDSEEEFLFEEITIDDLDTLLNTIADYNEIESASEKLTAQIGTYKDDAKKTQVAYIIVDWVEYDEELEAYTFRGETK